MNTAGVGLSLRESPLSYRLLCSALIAALARSSGEAWAKAIKCSAAWRSAQREPDAAVGEVVILLNRPVQLADGLREQARRKAGEVVGEEVDLLGRGRGEKQ